MGQGVDNRTVERRRIRNPFFPFSQDVATTFSRAKIRLLENLEIFLQVENHQFRRLGKWRIIEGFMVIKKQIVGAELDLAEMKPRFVQ